MARKLLSIILLASTSMLNAQVSDFDGNMYPTVIIGNQEWMAQNLRTTHLNDGTPIPRINLNTAWQQASSEALSWYDNDSITHHVIFGPLYNGFVAQNPLICPAGWSVPYAEDWDTMVTVLGGPNIAGGALKDASTEFWEAPNEGATNSSGFTGLPGGWRSQTDGSFAFKGQRGGWFVQQRGTGLAFRWLSWSVASAGNGPIQPNAGMSIRCFRTTPSTNVLELGGNHLKLYPNPGGDRVHLQLANRPEAGMQLRIYDMQGKQVFVQDIFDTHSLLQLEQLPYGLYLVGLWKHNQLLNVQRLMMQR
ncbi:MAG: FISUMP domain-containing protein [Bacteroidia bacterium]